MTFLNIAQMIVAIALIGVLLFQVRGGGLGGIFGQADSVYRTRRGAERMMLWFTVILSVIFIIISILTVRGF